MGKWHNLEGGGRVYLDTIDNVPEVKRSRWFLYLCLIGAAVAALWVML